MKKFKGLIFDFNGVLLLDQHLHDSIWRKIIRNVTGHEISDEEFRANHHGRSNREIFEVIHNRNFEPEEVKQRAEEKELAYQDLARQQGESYALAPGAVALFEQLKQQKIPFTIGTSSPPMNVAFYNTMLGLDRWFNMNKVACNDGTFRGKPAPDIFLKAANMLSLDPKDCVVIEDAQSGIAAAHAAGIGYIIAIGPREEHDRLAKLPGVNEVIENLTEVRVDELFT